jgi:MFS family permease
MSNDEITVKKAGQNPGTADNPGSAEARITAAYKSTSYRYFVLGTLTLVYVFNFIDRQVVNILGQAIIDDLGLSDAQFGALSGIAFAAVYATMGIPIARWADVGVRRNVIAISLTVWSGMTAVCGLTQNFWQMLLARAGVGIGEAGGSPPAHSMISDIFPASERSTALSIYSMGVYGGILVGYIAGGYLASAFSWRIAFIVVGLPGIVLAVLLRMFVKEPPRGLAEARHDHKPPSFGAVLNLLWTRHSFRHIALGCALHTFVTYGLGNFMPVFLGRVHHMPINEIGTWLGLVAGLGGLTGTFFGGYFSDKLANRSGDMRWHLWVPILSTLAAIPFYWLTFIFMDNATGAVLSWFIPTVIGGMFLGPCISMTHGLVGLRMRAVASAVLFFVLNLIGLGLGPLATGLLSDLFRPAYGDESIRYALASMVFVNVWCAAHYYMATRTLRADLASAPD